MLITSIWYPPYRPCLLEQVQGPSEVERDVRGGSERQPVLAAHQALCWRPCRVEEIASRRTCHQVQGPLQDRVLRRTSLLGVRFSQSRSSRLQDAEHGSHRLPLEAPPQGQLPRWWRTSQQSTRAAAPLSRGGFTSRNNARGGHHGSNNARAGHHGNNNARGSHPGVRKDRGSAFKPRQPDRKNVSFRHNGAHAANAVLPPPAYTPPPADNNMEVEEHFAFKVTCEPEDDKKYNVYPTCEGATFRKDKDEDETTTVTTR